MPSPILLSPHPGYRVCHSKLRVASQSQWLHQYSGRPSRGSLHWDGCFLADIKYLALWLSSSRFPHLCAFFVFAHHFIPTNTVPMATLPYRSRLGLRWLPQAVRHIQVAALLGCARTNYPASTLRQDGSSDNATLSFRASTLLSGTNLLCRQAIFDMDSLVSSFHLKPLAAL